MSAYRSDPRKIQCGDVVLVHVVLDDAASTADDFIPAEVLTIKHHHAEIVLCSSISRYCYWVPLEKLFRKMIA